LKLSGRTNFRAFQTLRSAAALILMLVGAGYGLRAQDSRADQIDAIFSAAVRSHEPGAAVIVRENGATIFERGYGMRDLRSLNKITPTTNFRLASFTKQFTAMSIMLLVHDGKLRYDEKLTEVFPDFPAYGKGIAIRNLLTHTSGLIDYETLMDKQYAGKSAEEIPQIHDAEVLALMKKQTTAKFPPGTSWEYSNSAFVVLATVVEKISGKTFGEFLRERIFEPLKMSRTLAYEYGKNTIPERAYGYTNASDVWLETDQSPTSATLGDGGIYTSVEDLTKWDDALRDHTLLSEQEMQPAITPVSVPGGAQKIRNAEDNQVSQYGFGWYLDPYEGHKRMWHSGSSIGFRTVIDRFTGEKLTIIILCNRTDLNPNALALKVADLFFAEKK
jgi:CubicO group peptidase (beta-lactamase class C family)